MKTSCFLLLMTLFCFSLPVAGDGLTMSLSDTHRDTIFIKGKVNLEELSAKGEIIVEVYENALLSLYNYAAAIHTLSLNADGSFRLLITPPDSLFYINIVYNFPGERRTPFQGPNLLLVRDKYDIHVTIGKKGFDFFGMDSVMLNFQEAYGKLRRQGTTCMNIDEECFALSLRAADSLIAEQRQLKAQYAGKLSPFITELIDNDWYYFRIWAELRSSMNYSRAISPTIRRAALASFQTMLPNISLKPPTHCELSRFYIGTLYSKEILTLACKYDTSFRSIPQHDLFDSLRLKYTGTIRDQLLTTFFLKTVAGTGETSNVKYLTKRVLSLVEDPGYRENILSINQARQPGKPAYAFSLQDTTGKYIRLRDFKGKALVMEFWFNGCRPCKILSKNMKPIIHHFEGNNDVVFITVNVDKDTDAWKKAIKTGDYTSDESINLNTNGEGHTHEMLMYYNFRGYPQMVIIDKKGDIVSANPPRPSNTENTLRLLDLIRTALFQESAYQD